MWWGNITINNVWLLLIVRNNVILDKELLGNNVINNASQNNVRCRWLLKIFCIVQIIAENYDLEMNKVNEDVLFKIVIMVEGLNKTWKPYCG